MVEITNDTDAPVVFHQKYATNKECKKIITIVLESEKLDQTFLSTFLKVPINFKILDDVMSAK